MDKIDVYITGMSNTDALKAALLSYAGPLKFYLQRLNPGTEGSGFREGQFDPDFVRDGIARSNMVALGLWGNWFNTLALVKHSDPFDFIYPSFDEDVDHSRRIIPFTQIKRKFDNNIARQLRMLDDLREISDKRMILIEPPPPIEDENHIRKFPGPFGDVLEAGVTPARIRRKMWKLQSAVFADAGKARGIEFLPVPADAVSAAGFLSPEYCYPDPTHANAKYGALVLAELETLAGAAR